MLSFRPHQIQYAPPIHPLLFKAASSSSPRMWLNWSVCYGDQIPSEAFPLPIPVGAPAQACRAFWAGLARLLDSDTEPGFLVQKKKKQGFWTALVKHFSTLITVAYRRPANSFLSAVRFTQLSLHFRVARIKATFRLTSSCWPCSLEEFDRPCFPFFDLQHVESQTCALLPLSYQREMTLEACVSFETRLEMICCDWFCFFFFFSCRSFPDTIFESPELRQV